MRERAQEPNHDAGPGLDGQHTRQLHALCRRVIEGGDDVRVGHEQPLPHRPGGANEEVVEPGRAVGELDRQLPEHLVCGGVLCIKGRVRRRALGGEALRGEPHLFCHVAGFRPSNFPPAPRPAIPPRRQGRRPATSLPPQRPASRGPASRGRSLPRRPHSPPCPRRPATIRHRTQQPARPRSAGRNQQRVHDGLASSGRRVFGIHGHPVRSSVSQHRDGSWQAEILPNASAPKRTSGFIGACPDRTRRRRIKRVTQEGLGE